MKNRYKIIKKEKLASSIYLIEVTAEAIVRAAKVGQFVILRVDEYGERIPLTIYQHNKETHTISLIFQEVGKTTKKLAQLNSGDYILDVVGPLGVPFDIEEVKDKRVVCIGGGVGAAPLAPKLRTIQGCAKDIITILGARSKELLILTNELKNLSGEFYITTDDGSYGIRGTVLTPLAEIFDKDKSIDLVIVIGPLIMMKNVCALTKKYNIKTIVSLNPIMVDGTGMCGCCRVSIGGKIKFACVDGPSFDGHLVDFDELIIRNQRFIKHERIAYNEYKATHSDATPTTIHSYTQF